jgi:hypothetical protein
MKEQLAAISENDARTLLKAWTVEVTDDPKSYEEIAIDLGLVCFVKQEEVTLPEGKT